VNTPLVVKRIEDKTTKQPRLPVTAELLQKEVRDSAARPLFFVNKRRSPLRAFARARSSESLSLARAACR